MDHNLEDVEIEIDSTLLETIAVIAKKEGISPEQYISNIIAQALKQDSALPPP